MRWIAIGVVVCVVALGLGAALLTMVAGQRTDNDDDATRPAGTPRAVPQRPHLVDTPDRVAAVPDGRDRPSRDPVIGTDQYTDERRERLLRQQRRWNGTDELNFQRRHF